MPTGVSALIALLAVTAFIALPFLMVSVGISGVLQLRGNRNLDFPINAIGLSMTVLLSWHALTIGVNGLRTFSWLLLSGGIVGFGYRIKHLREQRHSCDGKDRLRYRRSQLSSILMTLTVFMIQWSPLVVKNGLTMSAANNDVIAYAQVSEHVLMHSFGEAGRVNGADFGTQARVDVFGAYSLVGMASSWMPFDYSYLLLPLLLLAWLLFANALTRWLCFTSLLPPSIIGAVVGLTVSVPLLGYVGGNYFLSQILGMSFVLFFLAEVARYQLLENCLKNKRFWFTAIYLSLLTAAMLLTYPAVSVAALVVVCPILMIGSKWNRIRQLVYLLLASTMLGTVLVFNRVQIAISRALELRSIRAGWSLPLFGLDQALGNLTNEAFGFNVLSLGISSVLVVIMIALVIGGKATAVRWMLIRNLTIIVIAYASYLYIYLSADGWTYQAWKWLTFFIPLMLTSAIILVTASRQERLINSATLRQILFGVLISLLLINLGRFGHFYSAVADATPVDSEIRNLSSQPALSDLDAVNIYTGDYRESMWPALFVGDRRISIVNTSYYSATPMIDKWTLIKATYGGRTADLNKIAFPGARSVGSSYLLVPPPRGLPYDHPGAFRAELSALLRESTLVVGEELILDITVRNRGVSSWSSYGALSGSVNLGFRVVNAASSVTESESKVQIQEFPKYVLPGESVTVQVRNAFLRPGDYFIVISPIVEQVGRFSEFDSASQLEVKVHVFEDD